ncbi:MAG: hypothetical protein RLZZ299_2875 [Pseudomonadota bacterium]
MRTLWLALTLGGCAWADLPTGPDGAEGDSPLRNASPGASSDRSAPVALPASMTRVRVGLTPFLREDVLLATYEPLRAWLEAAWGVPVTLRVAPSYDTLGAWLRSGEVDVGQFSPYAWVRTGATAAGLVPVVSTVTEGGDTGAGYIVVRDDSAITRLDQLRGRRLACVDPGSASGYLMPLALLRARGLDPERDLAARDALGNHESVLLAVLDGRYDAGAVYQGALDALTRSRGIPPYRFRIVGKTGRMPHDLLAVRADAATGFADSLRTHLLGLNVLTVEGRRVLDPASVHGFAPVQDSSYDGIREAARLLGIATPAAAGEALRRGDAPPSAP